MSDAVATDGVFAVVPSYGHAPFVARALRSIFRQRQPPSRLLVIDDGSPDDSARIIAATLTECPFPCEFIVHDRNRGLCATLNEALTHCDAPFFCLPWLGRPVVAGLSGNAHGHAPGAARGGTGLRSRLHHQRRRRHRGRYPLVGALHGRRRARHAAARWCADERHGALPHSGPGAVWVG
ncbi:glycosyltransferase family 2 protein [Chloracidobacterium validum]|uniref:Glycosyltransferase family 2 protein n=1 Tax=Chloracidobacterium validum TaxID=2821543 RepID=A0ABX8B4V1_9BACT|nr:glycosyltransferase family 2 protein [Chloracidobacterium validum]